MHYRIFLFIFLLLTEISQSQSLEIGVMAGGSNYRGDLQEKYFDFNQMHFSFGGNLTYNIDDHWSVRGEIWKGNLSASDANSVSEFSLARNLKFNTRLYEASLVGIYRFLSLGNKQISPYVFGGFARFRINPYTHNTDGIRYHLFPLATEGQGLLQYPDNKENKRYHFSIPFGGGISWSVSPKWSIGLEFGFRKTFTDYIDDVSNVYVDEIILLQERGPIAVELAYRGGELAGGDLQFPAAGSRRGNSKATDLYYNSIFRIQYRLFGESPEKSKSRHRIDCPKLW